MNQCTNEWMNVRTNEWISPCNQGISTLCWGQNPMNTALGTQRELARECYIAEAWGKARARSLGNLISILLTDNGTLKTQSIQIHNMFGVGFGLIWALVLWRGKRKPRQHRDLFRFMCLDGHLTDPRTNREHLPAPCREVLRRMMEGVLEGWCPHTQGTKSSNCILSTVEACAGKKTAITWSDLCFRKWIWKKQERGLHSSGYHHSLGKKMWESELKD